MNSVVFYAPSGAPATISHSSLFPIEQLDPPGNTSGANHVGFFGTGGPQGVPFAVIVDRYQDETYITNPSGFNMGVAPFGLPESGRLINHKFVDASNVQVSGQPSQAVTVVPQESGTILIRFIPSGVPTPSVRTQNGLLRTVVLNASSGIDNVTSVVVGLKVQGYEPEQDSGWTQTAGMAAIDNRLFISDRNTSDQVHDFFVALSASPEGVGERNDFGFFLVLEFL